MADAAELAARYAPHIPAAVRAVADAAADTQRQVYAPTAEPGSSPTAVVVDAPAAPATPAAPAPAPTAPAAEDWEQKFRSLEGRFNSQVVTANERARVAEQTNLRLQGEIAELNMRLATAPAAAPAAANPQDNETWGEDLMAAARRQARAEIAPELDRLRQQLTAVEQRTNSVAAQSTVQSIEQQLAVLVGADWQVTNNDPAFMSWLGQPDPFSGTPRHQMMLAARDAGDATRVANFFNAYRAQHTAQPSPGAQPSHTPAGAARVPLETLAAPGAGRSAGNGAAPEQVIITQKDITQFYSDVNKGRYRGNPAGYAKREAEIFAATREGRVQA